MIRRICAVRLPGSSRARFTDAGTAEVELGDWISLDTGAGEEPGQIVVAPDQWTEPVEIEDALEITRRLEPDELERIANNVERARQMVSVAAQTLRETCPGCYLTGVRLTLDGERAIISWRGEAIDDESAMSAKLSRELGLDVALEREPDRTLLSGSTGIPANTRGMTFREMLESRMDALRDPGTFAPQGIPRLNSFVQTPDGPGRLVAVDIRHWKATVLLDAGEEITLSVDDLQQPE